MRSSKRTTDTPSRQAEALARLVGESVRLHTRLLAASDGMSRDLGMSSARWQVLSVVGRSDEPVTVSGLARWMGLARQSVQRIADALVSDGTLEYRPNPGHRRAPLLQVTAAGRRLLAQLDARRYRWAETVAADLDPGAIEAATNLLRKVRGRLGG